MNREEEETFLLSLDNDIIKKAKMIRASARFNPFFTAYIGEEDLVQEGRIGALIALRNEKSRETLRNYCLTCAHGYMLHLLRTESICSAGELIFKYADIIPCREERRRAKDYAFLYDAIRKLTWKQQLAIAFFYRLSLNGDPIEDMPPRHRADYRDDGIKKLRRVLKSILSLT